MTFPHVEMIGDEAQPLVILDDFHADPDALRGFAASAIFEPGRQHYPGIRAALPGSYLAAQLPAIQARVRWRSGNDYGVVLDQTFRFEELARLVGTLQQGTAGDAAAAGRFEGVNFA